MEKEIKKVFVSVPMRGRSEEDIKNDIDNAMIDLQEYMARYNNLEFIFVDNLISPPEGNHQRLYCLGEAIKKMGDCDWIIFCKNWERYSGCNVEHMVALQYGLKIFRYGNLDLLMEVHYGREHENC